jgi:hypothetical protein
MLLQRSTLELLDFSRLLGSHVVNQLLNGEAGGLTNLNELHGRKISPGLGARKSPVGIHGIPRWSQEWGDSLRPIG